MKLADGDLRLFLYITHGRGITCSSSKKNKLAELVKGRTLKSSQLDLSMGITHHLVVEKNPRHPISNCWRGMTGTPKNIYLYKTPNSPQKVQYMTGWYDSLDVFGVIKSHLQIPLYSGLTGTRGPNLKFLTVLLFLLIILATFCEDGSNKTSNQTNVESNQTRCSFQPSSN